MAKIDFPVATADGQVFVADTNVIYTYVGNPPAGYWSGYAGADSANLGDTFVKVAGDNMTGNLTLGTDKITLNATGSANFAGRVDGATFIVGDNPNSGNGTGSRLDVGKIYTARPSGTSFATYTTGNSTATSEITAEGTAKFAGNMSIGTTGSYTPSNPAISLNATNGSIIAAGTIKAGDLNVSSTTTRGASLGVSPATGQLIVQQTAAAVGTNKLVRVFHGDVSTVDITGDGSATFAGSLVTPDSGYRNSRGIKLYNTGIVQSVGVDISNVWMGFNTSDGPTGLATSTILANGSATFAGTGQFSSSASWPTTTVGKSGSRLLCGGDGIFTLWNETVGAGNYSSMNLGTKPGNNASALSGGIIRGGTVNATDGTGFLKFFVHDNTNSAVEIAEYKADGSANFSGDVVSRRVNTPYDQYSSLTQGGVDAQWFRSSDSKPARFYIGRSAENIFSSYLDGVPTAALRANGDLILGGTNVNSNPPSPNILLNAADGSASFAGPVYSAGNSSTDQNGWYASASQIGVQTASGFGNSTCFASYLGPATNSNRTIYFLANGSAEFDGNITAPNTFFNLEADDDTKYTTTTDADGVETRIYNGAVLDVKERLTKTDAALQALKTAAAAASDFAALKSAIATALANI